MRSFTCLSSLLVLALTGCALSNTAAPTAEPSLAIRGVAHGGQQPISGAHVYLFAANTTGYNTTAATYGSVSLLNSAANTTKDTSGGVTNNDYYVTTASDGSFTITGDYTCTSGQQVYLYAAGGDSGFGANDQIGLLAILGDCPGTGNFASSVPYVFMDEVSTIAAAYAFSGFAYDATHVSSSGTALAKTGVKNAFAAAANLASISTGQALTTTPSGNGTVPQTLINSLADILAYCINSSGASSPGCTTLSSYAKNGSTSPSDTATAAINIAHNPGANVASLFANVTAQAPFLPNLGVNSPPNDYTIGLTFTGAGLSSPYAIAIDGSGNVWIADNSTLRISELSPTGSALSPSTGFIGGGLSDPTAIAVDNADHVWIANGFGGLSEFNTSDGSAISTSAGYTGGGASSPYGIAIDGTGHAWAANISSGPLSEFSGSTPVSTSSGYRGGGLNQPYCIAIDGTGNVWAGNYGGNSVSKFNNSGTALSASGYTGGSGISEPYGIAVDGGGNVWTANSGNSSISKLSNAGGLLFQSAQNAGGLSTPAGLAIDGAGNIWVIGSSKAWSEFSSAGVAISPSTGYLGGNVANRYGVAIDGSGNVWGADYSDNTVSELVGAAVPVITPIAAGLPVSPTTDGTSSLGTRP